MKLIIHVDGTDYAYDPQLIDVKAAFVIRERAGWGIRTWSQKCDDWDPLALQLLYWLMLRQNGKETDPATIDFSVVEFGEAVTAASLEWIKAEAEAEALRAGRPKARKRATGATQRTMRTSSTTGTST